MSSSGAGGAPGTKSVHCRNLRADESSRAGCLARSARVGAPRSTRPLERATHASPAVRGQARSVGGPSGGGRVKSGAARGASSLVSSGATGCGSASTTATTISRGAERVTAAVTQHMPVHVQSSCDPLWWCPPLCCAGDPPRSAGTRPIARSQSVPDRCMFAIIAPCMGQSCSATPDTETVNHKPTRVATARRLRDGMRPNVIRGGSPARPGRVGHEGVPPASP